MSRIDLTKFGIRNAPVNAPMEYQRTRAGFKSGGIESDSSDEETINTAYIIKNKPPFKVVRKFFKENIKDLEDSD